MTNFTAKEIAKLNDLSVPARDMTLGTKLAAMVTLLNGNFKTGTPVNAVAATETLSVSGVVIDGETVTIGDDIYEFCADAAQGVTTVGNIPVDIESDTTKSTGTLTVDTQPLSGDTMTLDTKVYTFVPVGTNNADGEISVGADLAEVKVNIVAAINGTDSVNDVHPTVSAGAFAVNDCTITALVGGVAADSIATTETFDEGTNVFAAATLGSGADCIAADSITALVTSITASDTSGVGGADGAGDTLVLTADVSGIAANDISVAETMANGAFVATELAGGIDGTVGLQTQPMLDSSYIYFCIGDNTIVDANWRRISLGAAY